MIDYFETFVNTNGVPFPNTRAVNATGVGMADGTEFTAALIDDMWGFKQALLHEAGMTPNGVYEGLVAPGDPNSSQVMGAIKRVYTIGPGIIHLWAKNDDPAIFGDRVLLLHGQTIAVADYPYLVYVTYVGDALNASAPAFFKTSDAGGTIRSTEGTYFVLPDTRGRFPRGIDPTGLVDPDGASRLVGSLQDDELKSHTHNIGGAGPGGSAAGMTSSDNDNIQNLGTSATGGAETRPKNFAIHFAIGY